MKLQKKTAILLSLWMLSGCANFRFDGPEYARLVDFLTFVNSASCDSDYKKLIDYAYYHNQYFKNISFRYESKEVAKTISSMVDEFVANKNQSDAYCKTKLQYIKASVATLVEIEGNMLW